MISPDNKSREELNAAVRSRMRESGMLTQDAHEFVTLVPRDVSGADRTQADSYAGAPVSSSEPFAPYQAGPESYRIGDTIRFLRGNRRLGVQGKSYAQVIDSDTAQNRLIIRTQDGRTLTYDPQQASGVSVYESVVATCDSECDRRTAIPSYRNRGRF